MPQITAEQALALVGALVRYESLGVDANGEEIVRRDTDRFIDALAVADPELRKILDPSSLLPWLFDTNLPAPLRNRRLLGLFLCHWGDKLLVAGKENPPPTFKLTREGIERALEELGVFSANKVDHSGRWSSGDLATDLEPLLNALLPF